MYFYTSGTSAWFLIISFSNTNEPYGMLGDIKEPKHGLSASIRCVQQCDATEKDLPEEPLLSNE